jgi:hypothetical protein
MLMEPPSDMSLVFLTGNLHNPYSDARMRTLEIAACVTDKVIAKQPSIPHLQRDWQYRISPPCIKDATTLKLDARRLWRAPSSHMTP